MSGETDAAGNSSVALGLCRALCRQRYLPVMPSRPVAMPGHPRMIALLKRKICELEVRHAGLPRRFSPRQSTRPGSKPERSSAHLHKAASQLWLTAGDSFRMVRLLYGASRGQSDNKPPPKNSGCSGLPLPVLAEIGHSQNEIRPLLTDARVWSKRNVLRRGRCWTPY
jgi:hypothetical protein